MSDKDLLRIGILVVGLLLLAAIWFFGRPRREEQGRRRESRGSPAMSPEYARPRRLPVIVAQRQAHPAQVGLPGRPEFPAEPVPARPDDPEHCSRASHRAPKAGEKLTSYEETLARPGRPPPARCQPVPTGVSR